MLFVHVPKTGGVSVEETVKEACPDARKARVPIGRHATLGKIIKHEPQVIDYWTFGFVRNPWARMVSWYSMISAWDRRHGPASGKPQDVKHGSMRDGNEMWRAAAAYSGFDEFVMRGTEELPRVGTPQITYLRAPKHEREVDFIGRTENFVGGPAAGAGAPRPRADARRCTRTSPSTAPTTTTTPTRRASGRGGLRRGHRALRLHLLTGPD